MKAYYNEIDPYCCKVLEKQIKAGNLPQGDVDCRDIRDVKGDELRGYGQKHLFAGIGGIPLGFQWAGMPAGFDIITGGFPCQDISTAGNRAGIDGARSGLWAEYRRLICELRPGIVFVENVAALLTLGIERVLGDLAASGYDAEWRCLRASDFGALHRRDRIWIVAYPASDLRGASGDARSIPSNGSRPLLPHAEHDGLHEAKNGRGDGADVQRPESAQGQNGTIESQGVRHPRVLAYAVSVGQSRPGKSSDAGDSAANGKGQTSNAFHVRLRSQWAVEPNVGRVANGIPARVDRLKGLGNAVVPQIAEYLARRILATFGDGGF